LHSVEISARGQPIPIIADKLPATIALLANKIASVVTLNRCRDWRRAAQHNGQGCGDFHGGIKQSMLALPNPQLPNRFKPVA